MGESPATDPRIAALRDRLARLLPGGIDSLGPLPEGTDALDQALACVDAIETDLAGKSAFAAQAEGRLDELTQMIVALVSFDYSKEASISGKDDAFDGLALGLNMLARELSASTVSKAYVNDIIESMHDMLIVVDGDAVIRSVNQSVCDLRGIERDKLVGARLDALLPAMTPGEIGALIEQGGAHEQEIGLLSRDGTAIPVSFSASVLRDRGDRIQGLVCVARDLTESKRIEEERWRLREAVARQGIMLEELSTPLIPIRDDILVMPLVGSVDEQRARRMMETLLQGIAARRARVAILDITGVRTVDETAMEGIVRAMRGAQLMGARVILTGISPQVAMRLAMLSIDMGGIVTCGTLKDGIEHAMKQKRALAWSSPRGA